MNVYLWFLYPVGSLEETINESLKNIDFYGFKVLQLKQEPDANWYKSLRAISEAFTKFVLDNFQSESPWTGHLKAEDFFQSVQGQAFALHKGGAGGAKDSLLAQIQAQSLAS